MDTLSSAPNRVNDLRGPTAAEADAVARLIGHMPENAPQKRRRAESRYHDIDVHRQAGTQWPDGPLPKLSRKEAISAAKRLWRAAVGLPWPGEWRPGRGNHRTGPRFDYGAAGTYMLVNPGQGWKHMVHDLSHHAYNYLTSRRPTEYAVYIDGAQRFTTSRTARFGKTTLPICSEKRLDNFQHVKRSNGHGRIHHSDAHAELERDMIRMVLENGWLDGRLK